MDVFMPFGTRGNGSILLGAALETAEEEPREPGWREADVARAISTAEKSGLSAFRIDIALDGTISIVVGIEAAADATTVAEKRAS